MGIFSFAFGLIVVIPLWRIFERAGMAPAIALVVLIPVVGLALAAAILAFARWRDAYGERYQPDLFDRGRR